MPRRRRWWARTARARHRMRPRQGDRRLVVDQCDGLCARQSPYFRRQEAWEEGAGPYRGADGPLTTRWSRYPDPVSEAFAAAGLAAGHTATEDYNGAQQEGFGRWQATIRDGRRCSAAVAYLRPALGRQALTVETDTLATRVVLDGRRAIGVEYIKRGARVTAHADREVILAAGVINTPQLLMLSGIGDPDDLRLCGIPGAVPLKGVGRNLQDHISAGILWRRTAPGPLHAKMRLDRIALDLGKTQTGAAHPAMLPRAGSSGRPLRRRADRRKCPIRRNIFCPDRRRCGERPRSRASDPVISGCYHRINAETLMKRAVSAKAVSAKPSRRRRPGADAPHRAVRRRFWAPAGRSIRHKVTGRRRPEGRDPASGASPCFPTV
jgi:hypothetical protein